MTVSLSTIFLWLAFAVAAFGTAGHISAGGRMFVDALFATDQMTEQAKWLGYVGWHAVSLLLVSFALAFASVALGFAARDVAIMAALMAGALSLICIGMGVVGGEMLKVPAPYLFGVIALSGAAGVLLD